MKKIIAILIELFIIILIGYNFNELNIIHDRLYPYHQYFSHPQIRLFYYLAIVLNTILFLIILITIFDKKFENLIKKLSIIIIIIPIILTIILFGEYYYGSTFYYGEVRDKQGFPFCGINYGFIGSVILTSYSFFSIFKITKYRRKIKLLLFASCIVVIVVLHFSLYKIFEIPWKMMGS